MDSRLPSTITSRAYVPTGLASLDQALGGQGIPKGHLCEITGRESAGKTTLCLQMIKAVQEAGGIAAWIDADLSLSPDYAQLLGVNPAALWVAQPLYIEQVFKIASSLARPGAVDLLVIDSATALPAFRELQRKLDPHSFPKSPPTFAQALRTLKNDIRHNQTAVVITSRLLPKDHSWSSSSEAGVNQFALSMAAAVRLEVEAVNLIQYGKETLGERIGVQILKNFLRALNSRVEFDIIYQKGICTPGDWPALTRKA